MLLQAYNNQDAFRSHQVVLSRHYLYIISFVEMCWGINIARDGGMSPSDVAIGTRSKGRDGKYAPLRFWQGCSLGLERLGLEAVSRRFLVFRVERLSLERSEN